MYYIQGDGFPNPNEANADGLLAIGGDLSVQSLLNAYSMGIFPWFNEDEPILWWHPDPRLVLFPKEVKVSKSMKQLLNKQVFEFSVNEDFEAVIGHCKSLREASGTWIGKEVLHAYLDLHVAGFAHSFEVRREGKLVGGLYGVGIGKVFYGESMFSLESNASKAALIYLCYFALQNGIELIDCQQSTNHLKSMGAKEISRNEFLDLLEKYID